MTALAALRKDLQLPILGRASALLKFIQVHISENNNLSVQHIQTFTGFMSSCSNDIRVRMLLHHGV